jgi:hypothetical protein
MHNLNLRHNRNPSRNSSGISVGSRADRISSRGSSLSPNRNSYNSNSSGRISVDKGSNRK